jgi:hypothetical protein
MPNLHVLKSNKLTRVFLISLGVVAASITCVSPASADEPVSVDGTTFYRDFQVYSSGGDYTITASVNGEPSPVDPVIHLYRGTSRAGYDFSQAEVSGDFLAVDDDTGAGLNAYLSGSFSSGLDNYVIRVSSYAYWSSDENEYPTFDGHDEIVYLTATPTESYILSYTGFSSGTVDTRVTSTQVMTRRSHNLSFSKSLFGSDTLSDWDGQLRKTVDSINKKWGSLIK